MAEVNETADVSTLLSSGCLDVHSYCDKMTWDALAWTYIYLPIIVQVVLGLLFVPLHFAWTKIRSSTFARFVRQFVGTADVAHVQRPCLMGVFFCCQFVGSALHTGIWIYRSYSHVVDFETYVLEVIICSGFTIHYILLSLKAELSPGYPWSAPAIIDVFTIVPVFTSTAPFEQIPWLSWSYLRVVRVLIAFQRIQQFGVLRNFSEVGIAAVLAAIKTVALVVVLAGTVMILEILGDPVFLQEEFVTTNMGEISFAQMVYWIFTTISTVGYGDFSPSTLLSRLFIIVSILVGVTFFSQEIGSFVELRHLQDSGRGSYKASGKSEHVVVVGGGVANCSSTLATFLGEIFMPEHKEDWPDCSMMSMSERSSNMDELFRRLPKQAQRRAKYFVGNPMSETDLDRLRVSEATLVVVLADMQTLDRDGEDESNILRALALKAYSPGINMRLMLLRPQNLTYAINVGLRSKWCFSALELKSALLAHSCRCFGWSTLISNLLLSVDYDALGHQTDPGWEQYQWGLGMEIYGFCVHADHVGKTFSDFALKAMESYVTPIAVQIKGKIIVNPVGHVLAAHDVVFAFAQEIESGDPLASDLRWKSIFATNQRLAKDVKRRTAHFKNAWADAEEAAALAMSQASPKESREPAQAHAHGTRVLPWMHDSGGQSGTQALPKNTLKRNFSKTRTKSSTALGKVEIDHFEDLALRIAEQGGHYVLILLGDNLWQQALAFTEALRCSYIPVKTPIIIFTRAGPNPELIDDLFNSFEKVSFLLGNSRRPSDLSRAGVETAQSVVMLSCANGGDPRMVDGAGVISLCSMESELKAQGLHVPMILELQREDSIKLMPLQVSFQDADLGSSMTEDAKMAEEVASTDFNMQPRFASGNIFNANCLGSLLADAFYTPGIIELFEALTFGEAVGQTSFPWQFEVPTEYVGRTYGELAELLLGKAEKSVPVGIYRASLVLCCPQLGEKLLSGDQIFVLGTAMFGSSCKSGRLQTEALASLQGAGYRDHEPPSPPSFTSLPEPSPQADAVGKLPQDVLDEESC
eukprot:TRINITY_DN42025_c0_g1_i1.p1 TRINITY_DN42025_c0_g1~~TRINITY_DN42025_c0_g1_i1.p1  ORF type:complete len:1052 (-),score=177.06 TRINITY_DN42025_c0_g1_i1:123-3236(-)